MLKWKRSLAAVVLAVSAVFSLAVPAAAAETAPPVTAAGMTLNTTEHDAYISGSGSRFNPSGEITRAEAAQILSRLLPSEPPATVSYLDVADTAWYAQAARMIGSLGVMRAGESLFLPNEAITRGELIYAVACFFPANTSVVQFIDVSPWDPNSEAYLTARAQGWVTGFEDGTLRPDQPVTRAEAVSIINRALGRVPDKSYIDTLAPFLYLDVSRDSWYFYDVMEASVSHQHTGSNGEERWISHTAMPSSMTAGFHLIDGWLYYYDPAQGNVLRDTSMGNFTFDAQGHFTSGNAGLDAKLRDIVMSKTNDGMTQEQKLRALYVYTRDSFTYLRRPAYQFGVLDFMEKDAMDMLSTGYGNCYSYASVFWYLSRWIGYDAKIYSGTVGSNRAPHSWVEINFDGKDYIFDTELEMAYHRKGRYEINLYKYIDVDNWRYVK